MSNTPDTPDIVELDSPKVTAQPEPDERKVTLTIYTSPSELRFIADELDRGRTVRVNWYHTRYIFKNENTLKE